MISIKKIIDWKIGRFDEIVIIANSIHSKKIPIHDPQDNQKICDLGLQIDGKTNPNSVIPLTIKSSPVSKTVFFKATVIALNAGLTEKLHERFSDFF